VSCLLTGQMALEALGMPACGTPMHKNSAIGCSQRGLWRGSRTFQTIDLLFAYAQIKIWTAKRDTPSEDTEAVLRCMSVLAQRHTGASGAHLHVLLIC
jgi:hypothetical protein